MPHDPAVVDDLSWPGPAATQYLEQAESCGDEAAVTCKGEVCGLGTKCSGWELVETGIPAQHPMAAWSQHSLVRPSPTMPSSSFPQLHAIPGPRSCLSQ
uniref:Uncharacterized protein n=1 Tax=Strix occidentalis caurina TaxID=311401 RepID=A0A8D0EMX9_STROC